MWKKEIRDGEWVWIILAMCILLVDLKSRLRRHHCRDLCKWLLRVDFNLIVHKMSKILHSASWLEEFQSHILAAEMHFSCTPVALNSTIWLVSCENLFITLLLTSPKYLTASIVPWTGKLMSFPSSGISACLDAI